MDAWGIPKRVVVVVYIKVLLVIKRTNVMKTRNRDLLVLLKDEFRNEQAIENELEKLNELLHFTETIDNYCIAYEVIDLNQYKIHHQRKKIIQVINQEKLKPFEFICNKN